MARHHGGQHYGGLRYGGLRYGGLRYGGLRYGGLRYGGLRYGGQHYGGLHYGGLHYGGLHYRGLHHPCMQLKSHALASSQTVHVSTMWWTLPFGDSYSDQLLPGLHLSQQGSGFLQPCIVALGKAKGLSAGFPQLA